MLSFWLIREGSMAVDSSQLNSASRDAYWQVTQSQLKSAQTRGDVLSLLGVGLLGLLLWQFHEPGDDVSAGQRVLPASHSRSLHFHNSSLPGASAASPRCVA